MTVPNLVDSRMAEIEHRARYLQSQLDVWRELARAWHRRHRSLAAYSIVATALLVTSIVAHVWRSL